MLTTRLFTILCMIIISSCSTQQDANKTLALNPIENNNQFGNNTGFKNGIPTPFTNTDPNIVYFKIRILGNSKINEFFRTYTYGPKLAYWVNTIEFDPREQEHGYEGSFSKPITSVSFTKDTGKGNGDYGFVTDKNATSIKTDYFDLGKLSVLSYDTTQEKTIRYAYFMYGSEKSFSDVKNNIAEVVIPKNLDTSKVHLFTIHINNNSSDTNYNVSYDGYEGQITPPQPTYQDLLYKVRFDIDRMTTSTGAPLFKIAGVGLLAGQIVYADTMKVFDKYSYADESSPYAYSIDEYGYGLKTDYIPNTMKVSYDESGAIPTYINGTAEICSENEIQTIYDPSQYRPGMVLPYEFLTTKLTNLPFNLALPTMFRATPGRVHLFTITYRTWSPIPSLHYDGIEQN